MSIRSLSITHFRNIQQTGITCSPFFNLFYGNNAAGKTSVLEAIYYLTAAKSFRTHHHDRLILTGADSLTLLAEMQLDQLTILGLSRSRNTALNIRLNGESIRSVASISQLLPIQFIGSDSHRLLSDGPKERRQFIDWGLFHVKPLFFNVWKNFQSILMQRNAALKANASKSELQIWNDAFSAAGEALNTMRIDYITSFKGVFNEIIHAFLPTVSISVDYFTGWDSDITLAACLSANVPRETFAGHSLFGPHRADLLLTVNDLPVEDCLSQGQQKLVSYALKLAQGIHLQNMANKSPVYLIDDLPSELDTEKRSLVSHILASLNAQVFITGINPDDLMGFAKLNNESKLFHVKQGAITEHKVMAEYTDKIVHVDAN